MQSFFADADAAGPGIGSMLDPWNLIGNIDQAGFAPGGSLTLTGDFTDAKFELLNMSATTSNRFTVFATDSSINISGLTAGEAERGYVFRSSAPFSSIIGGTYSGADDNDSGGQGIFVVQEEGVHAIDVTCDGNVGEGLKFAGCKDHVITGGTFTNNDLKGLVAVAQKGGGISVDPLQTGGYVAFNFIGTNGGNGLQVGGSGDNSGNETEPGGVNICEFNESTGNNQGAKMEFARHQIFRNNSIHHNGTNVVLDGCREVEIYGNSLIETDSGGSCILFDPGDIAKDIHIYSNFMYTLVGGTIVRGFLAAGLPGLVFNSNIVVSDDQSQCMKISGENGGTPAIIANNTFAGSDDLLVFDNVAGPCNSIVKNNIFYEWGRRAIDEDADDNNVSIDNNCYFSADTGNVITMGGVNYDRSTLTDIDAGALIDVDPEFGVITGDPAERDYKSTNPLLEGAGVDWDGSDTALDFTLLAGYNSPPSIGSYGLRSLGSPTLTTHSSTMGLLVNAGNSGGVSLFTYANSNIATAQVTGADFWATPKFPLNPLDVIWCQLSDGFVKLSMTTATTAEAV